MLSCLNNYIGLKGCGDGNPSSGLFVNSLPGIELEAFNRIASADQASFIGAWNDVQARAIERFRTDFRGELSKRWKLKTTTQGYRPPREIDATSTTPAAAGQYRGRAIYLNGYDDTSNTGNFQYTASNLERLFITNVSVYLTVASDFTVKVIDLDTHVELHTQDVTGVVGWNVITVNQQFEGRNFFVGYDASGIESVEMQVPYTYCYGPYNYSNYGYSGLVRGATTDDLGLNITKGENAFGLTLEFTVNCSFDELICLNLEILKRAFWLLCGIEFCDERINSDRFNNYTAFNRETALKLKQNFMAQYRGGEDAQGAEFMGELVMQCEGIELNSSDKCVVCNAPIRFEYAKL